MGLLTATIASSYQSLSIAQPESCHRFVRGMGDKVGHWVRGSQLFLIDKMLDKST